MKKMFQTSLALWLMIWLLLSLGYCVITDPFVVNHCAIEGDAGRDAFRGQTFSRFGPGFNAQKSTNFQWFSPLLGGDPASTAAAGTIASNNSISALSKTSRVLLTSMLHFSRQMHPVGIIPLEYLSDRPDSKSHAGFSDPSPSADNRALRIEAASLASTFEFNTGEHSNLNQWKPTQHLQQLIGTANGELMDGSAKSTQTGLVFNVRDFGALGNGSHDDTKAIQDAVNAALLASGTVYFPKPPNYYRVTNTIDVIPSKGSQEPVNFKGEGNWNMIEFHSKKGRACFNIRGIKRAIFEGVHILCKYDDQIAWNIACEPAFQSQSGLIFRLCHVGLAGKSSTGFHLTTEGGSADISTVSFETCNVGSSDGKGGIGWLDTNANGLGYLWTNCGGSHLHSFYNNMGREATLSENIDAIQKTIRVNNPEIFMQRGGKIKIKDEIIGYTNVLGSALIGCTRGIDGSSAAAHGKGSNCRIDTWQGGGGGGKTFINCVTSFNENDFLFGTAGDYLVLGGRFEVGKKFARFGTWGTAHTVFSVIGATLTKYGRGNGADEGVVFHIGMPVKMLIEGCMIFQEDYTSNMIKDLGRVSLQHSGPGASITIRN